MTGYSREQQNKSSAVAFQHRHPGSNATRLQDNRPKTAVQQMQAAAIQKKAAHTAAPVAQLARKTIAKETAGGAIGLGIAGAVIGSYVPVVGTLAGGLIGLTVGALGGLYHSQPKIYPNKHKKDYQDELEKYEYYKQVNRDAESEYVRGTIIKYSPSKSRKFTDLLHQGQVLYAYDVSNQLSIGSNAGPIKHAIVAGGKNVKAAGMAVLLKTKAEDVFGAYEATAEKVERLRQNVNEFELPATRILQRLGLEAIREGLESDKLKEGEHEILSSFYQSKNALDHYIVELQKLSLLERKQPQISKNNTVQLDNNSGHYHPDKSTKDEAFEGWHDAGFKSLTWKTFK